MMKHVLAPLAALVALTAPASAQVNGALPFSIQDGKLVLEALNQTLTLPMPDWATGAETDAALSEVVSTRFVEESGQAHLEVYPRGEGEAFWTKIYGARLSNQPGMSLADFRSVVINVYAQSCDPQAIALFQFEEDQEDVLPPVGYVCGAYLDDFEAFAGQGEVMIMGFYKSDKGVAMVYQEWRGDAFDTEDPASWPVTPDEVEAYMARLKTDVTLLAAD
ncbi:hypothetical protein [Devosia sediminis]|uniref:Uncharacterized protein n=1 Tax=Devosia sediminis TaxID=2798801 RepID=A0A934MRY5_9HYPH|nr:hypothetical protein [Devosia sediminis]MBJ3785899.1 hypothetical protein [Devosia sediminis]